MAVRKQYIDRIILFSSFLLFAVIIVIVAYTFGKGKDITSDNTQSFAYTTSDKVDFVSQPGIGISVVDINTADVNELDALPGIGPKKAQAIIDYREIFGPFASPEDIMNVIGIGEATYANMKDYITVK